MLAQQASLEKLSSNPSLAQLIDELNHWRKNHNATTFANALNQLIYLWLNAIQDGATTQDILNLLKCFELKSFFGISNSSTLHCFLFDLLAETSQQYQQTLLDYALNYDAHTQLPHSNQLFGALEKIIKNSSGDAFICILSTHFQLSKNNPVFSHAFSTELSIKIAKILQQSVPSESQLFYSGNCEFDILIPRSTGDIQLNLIAAKLQRTFEEILFVGNESVLITPFIGYAFSKQSSDKIHDLYNQAKLALENALYKQQHLVVYTKVLNDLLSDQNDLENKVIEAFSADSLTLFFQPLINLKDNSCAGAELLLRWSEKSQLNVYPSLTIEILNKVGKGKLFTRWLINSACRSAAELKYEHKLDLYLTINLRAEDLHDIELPYMLLQALGLWRLSPSHIVLEVTENGILELNETTKSVIKALSENGFRLALDDFGTGFSSLSRLRTMPIDLIKIDQSFVRDIAHSKSDLEIVKSIAMLANSLGKEVLAEGVEDKACLDLIKKMNIHKCQGYYFAKPMPFEQFIKWAKKHN